MFNLINRHSTLYLLKTTSFHTSTVHRSLSSSTTASTPKLRKYSPRKYSPINKSFTVSYLIDSCGFPRERAITASKYLCFKTADRADSVREFFINQGFTEAQVSNVLIKFPLALTCNPETNLLPKFQFLSSLGLSTPEIVKLLSARPKSLGRSLKKHLEPTINLLRDLLQSEDRAIIAIKRCAWILDWDFQSNMVPNLQVLRNAGVPGEKMMYVLTYQPRDFLVDTEKFKNIVDRVLGMGFDPTKCRFMLAIHAIRSMTKVTWDKKMELYKKWGWSEAEIALAFRNDPWCMMKSEEKIDTTMGYLVNKMGFDTAVIAKNSLIISMSMEKRIIPRCQVYEYCLNKGLFKHKNAYIGWLKCSEVVFLKRLQRLEIEKEVPDLVKLYQEKIKLCKSS